MGFCETCGRPFALSTRGLKRYCNPDCRRTKMQSRDRWLKARYGISSADFDSMLLAQGGNCAVCLSPDPGGQHDRFNVDHCHTTGAVRGLLCNACNQGIGKLGDSPEILRRAAAYLERGQ